MMEAASGTERRGPVLALAGLVETVIVAVCKVVVIATGVALLAAITVGVASRYVITVGGADWAEELPKQIFAWFIMAGVVLAVHGGNHIAVDILHQFLPERLRRPLIVAVNLLIAGAYVYLSRIAFEVAAIAAFEINPVLGTPGSLPYYALGSGSLLTAAGALVIAVRVAVAGSAAAPQGRPEDSVQ